VVFKSGVEGLRKGEDALARTKYPQTFPGDAPVKIVRKGMLSCSPYTKECRLILMDVENAAVDVN